MRLSKGFGKNYFTLNAITATVNQVTLDAISTRVQNFHISIYKKNKEDEELAEELTLLCPLQLSTNACHCNCYFLSYTRKTLRIFTYQRLFYNYFKTLNSAISPPF